jgi:hypothetical protein
MSGDDGREASSMLVGKQTANSGLGACRTKHTADTVTCRQALLHVPLRMSCSNALAGNGQAFGLAYSA